MPNYEVIHRSLDLAATMQAGIEHIQLRFAEGRFEEMLPLLQDITEALLSIERACSLGGSHGSSSRDIRQAELLLETGEHPDVMPDFTDRIRLGLAQLVLAYENADWEKAVKAWDTQVIPGFTLYKQELERSFECAMLMLAESNFN